MDASEPRLPFALEKMDLVRDETPSEPLRAGDLCPQCGQAKLDYDGMLNLTCPICGYQEAGCFT